MQSIQKRKGAPIHRRDILKSAGCLVMLPALESFGQEAKGDDAVKANRLFCMNIGNGMCSDNFPTSTGKDYQSSSTFQPLEKLKNDYTLCTNLRNYGDHESTMYAFAEYSDHRNPQLIKDSVDEIAASHIGMTRVLEIWSLNRGIPMAFPIRVDCPFPQSRMDKSCSKPYLAK